MTKGVFDSWAYDSRPGLILGPYESLVAIIAWLGERVAAINANPKSRGAGIVNLNPRVHPAQRDSLIAALLLFGKFDALAGLFLVDSYLATHGVALARREIVGDILPMADDTDSPFAHTLERGLVTHPYQFEFKPERPQIAALARGIVRALRRAGIHTNAGDIRSLLKRRAAMPANTMALASSGADLAVTASLGMLQRAIAAELPLLSADTAAPAWNDAERLVTSVSILRIVWDEVAWLPRPTTFRAAIRMNTDDRVVSLRRAVELWHHKIATGDLADWNDLRADIRRSVAAFSRTTWSSRVARLTTYVAVPVALVEPILGNVAAGVTLTCVGAAAQAIGDVIARYRKGHWLSIGSDFVTRRPTSR